MQKQRVILLASALTMAGAGIAVACGPYFPWQLLDDRAETLEAVPANSFSWEVGQLVPQSGQRFRTSYVARETAEADGLPWHHVALIKTMRIAPDGDAAYAAGGGLPPAVRLYTAGAVDYLLATGGGRMPAGDRALLLERAAARFAAVLQQAVLQQDDPASRATWAAYMLGRARAGIARLAPVADACDVMPAAEAFQQVRALARQGRPDPLGLALASYGEEARLHLDLTDTPQTCEAGRNGQALLRAVTLYAEQANQESNGSGMDSLRIVLGRILGDEALLRSAVAQPLLQRMLVAHLLYAERYGVDIDDGSLLRSPRGGSAAIERLLVALESQGLPAAAGTDRLAVLAYDLGRFDLAGPLADRAAGPLSAWVKAKLALRAGDRAGAAAQYATAVRAMTPDSTDIEPGLRFRLRGEQGTLALARGEYEQALEHLYAAAPTYWSDLAYVAERVVSSDELKRFVDAAVPESGDQEPEDQWGRIPRKTDMELRQLLGRRLVREGRVAEAIPYFPVRWQHPWSERQRPVRQQAADYAAALRTADKAWTGIGRAEGLFAAARLARYSGMEIMGYEQAPDFFIFNGAYDTGSGQTDVKAGPFVTSGEVERFEASTPVSDQRFHYRYLAVNQAIAAADLLPPRSQAFAAVLCHATVWLQSVGAVEQSDALYRRYLREGAYVPWGRQFGMNCPAPDFAGAHKRQWSDYALAAKRWLKANLVIVIATLVLAAATGAVTIRRRRAG